MLFPVDLQPQRSRVLVALTAALHALAAAVACWLPWPLPWRLSLLAALAFSAWRAVRRSPVTGLRLSEKGSLTLLLADGLAVSANVEAGSVVFPRLVVLRARELETRRSHSLVLLPDSLPQEHFRLLRVWLRWRTERERDKA